MKKLELKDLRVGMKVVFDCNAHKNIEGIVEWRSGYCITNRCGLGGMFSGIEGFESSIKASQVSNIRRHPDFWPCVGDIIVGRDGRKAKVLAVMGECFLKSEWNDYGTAAATSAFTVKEAIKDGWVIEGLEEEKPEEVELTIEEIAEKFGIKTEQVKIKDKE